MSTSVSKVTHEFEPGKRYKFSLDKFKEDSIRNNFAYEDCLIWANIVANKEIIPFKKDGAMYYIGKSKLFIIHPEWCVPMKNAKTFELGIAVAEIHKHKQHKIIYSYGHHFMDAFKDATMNYGNYVVITANYGYAKEIKGCINLASEPKKGYKPVTAAFI